MSRVFVSAFLQSAQAASLFKAKTCRQLPDNLPILASVSALNFRFTVPPTATTAFVPVVSDNLPLISLTAFVYPHDSSAVLYRLVSSELPEARSN
jgi:hypothetical protein